MPYRYVHTEYWDDTYIEDKPTEVKFVYLYLITKCPNQCGIFEIAPKKISYDTGYPIDTISKSIDILSKDGKIFCADKLILLKNYLKYQANRSPKVMIKIRDELAIINNPLILNEFSNCIHTLSIPYPYPIDTSRGRAPESKVNGNGNEKEKEREGECKGETSNVDLQANTTLPETDQQLSSGQAEPMTAAGGNMTGCGTKPEGRSNGKKSKNKDISDEEWLRSLRNNPAYEGIPVDVVVGKLLAWCENKGYTPTRARLLNWLNREDRPIAGGGNGTDRKRPEIPRGEDDYSKYRTKP
ncbi:MAG: hypothetical protein H7843_09215 [Nitrospirota bacterium]